MNTRRSSISTRLLILVLLLGAIGGMVSADSVAPPPAPPAVPNAELAVGTHTSAKICGECHQDIYGMWKDSMHAQSFRDPIFQVEFMQAVMASGDSIRTECLRCHGPTSRFTKDAFGTEALTREGVTCDFCHSVTGIKETGTGYEFQTDVGGDKRGPNPGLTSPAHGIQHLELFTRSEFCADCHELTNAYGVPVMTTYSEWKNGPYASEKTCQDCHMPFIKGDRVVETLRKSSGKVNLHNLQGGHSLTQLHKVAKARILDVSPSGKKLWVKVRVSNVGSGHSLPTGHPGRSLVLEVEIFKDNKVFSKRTKKYRRRLGDENGKPLTTKYEAIHRARKVLTDNRIPPGGSDDAIMDFPNPGPGDFFVEARLYYFYEPMVLESSPMKIQLTQDRKVISP